MSRDAKGQSDASPDVLDAVIVGAGIGGLSAAWALRRHRILVLEASDRVGGRIRSESRAPYWLNFGAHLFGDESSPAGALAAELGLEARPIPGSRMGVALRGKVVSGGPSETFPFRLPLSLPARLSFIKLGLRLRTGVMQLLDVQQCRPGENPQERRVRQLRFENDRTLKEYVGPLHPEVEAMLRTMTERTSASLERMAAGYGLTSFGQVWSKHSFGRNLVGGSSRLPETLAARLGPEVVRTSSPVMQIRDLADGVEIVFRDRHELRRIRSRYVVVATEADIAADLLPDIPAETRAALRDIRYGPFLSAAVLTGEQGAMAYDANYAIATPGLAFGVFFNQASTMRQGIRAPGGSLMLSRGAEGAARLMEQSDGLIEQQMLDDLFRLFPQTRGTVREISVQRWPKGAPYSFPGRAGIQAALTRPLGRIHLAGDYLEFPCMDAAIATGQEAAERIMTALERTGDPETDSRTMQT